MIANNAFMISEMKEKAKKEGAQVGRVEILLKQLMKKFKSIPDEYKNKINKLSKEKIERLAEEIFDLQSIEDLKKYF